jgi:hypothetical protein
MNSRTTEEQIRFVLLAILGVATIGTLVELLLLKHVEEWQQLIPVVLLPLSGAVAAWSLFAPSPRSLRTLEFMMVCCIASGLIGVVQHFQANLTDAAESTPGLSGLALYQEAAMGSIPALAPGTMILLGSIGLLSAFRHPARGAPGQKVHQPPAP